MPDTQNTNDNPFLRKKIPPPELELVSQTLELNNSDEKTVFNEGEEVLLKISIVDNSVPDNSEGVGQTSQAYAVSKLPDVCLVGGNPVPFQIKGDFGTADEEHPTVRFRNFKAVTTRSFVPQVTGDQPGKNGGIISGCNEGVAYIEKNDIVRTVRVNGEKVVRHGDPVKMNAPSHGGPHNTIGEVYYKPLRGTITKVRISETGEIAGDTNPPVTLETPQEENWFQQQLANAKELAGQAWNKIKELNKEYKLVQRGMGVVQVVGGVGEIVLGVLGWATPEPTMVTKVLGTVAIVHGVDDTWAGLKQVRTGKSQDNYTQQMATEAAKKMGASKNVAEWIGMGTDIGVGLVNPIGALKKVAVETAEEGVEKIVKETVEEVSEEATEQAGKKTAQQAGEETAEQAGKNTDGIEVSGKPKINKEIPCFLMGTLVVTPTGPHPIESLTVGDVVFAFDEANRKIVERSIYAVFKNKTVNLVEINLGKESIHTTKRHRLWIEDKQDWLEARYLKAGTYLQTITGKICKIQDIVIQSVCEQETFNLSVVGCHTYFVGQQGVLVHNSHSSEVVPTGKIYYGIDADSKIIYVGKTKQPLSVRQLQHQYEGKTKLGYEWKKGMTLQQVDGLDGLTDDEMKWHERKVYDDLKQQGYDLKNKQVPYKDEKMKQLEKNYCP